MPSKHDAEVVRVAELFADVARALAQHQDLTEILDKIVALAVEHLEGCEYAGITLVEEGMVSSPASSNDIPRTVDAIQAEVGEGPCLDAIKEHEVFRTADLEADDRWPAFARRAYEETGVRSILGLRLFIEANTMGALNLYSTRRDAFDEVDIALAAVFAAHAAVAMSGARREQALQRKAESRDVIGRAKGILMNQSNITDDAAFDILRRASQRMNVKLVDVARDIAEHGPRPGPSATDTC